VHEYNGSEILGTDGYSGFAKGPIYTDYSSYY